MVPCQPLFHFDLYLLMIELCLCVHYGTKNENVEIVVTDVKINIIHHIPVTNKLYQDF